MYRLLETENFKASVDPDMQDAIQNVVTAICERFEIEEHTEYLRGYNEGECDERNASKAIIKHYLYERDIASGTRKRNIPLMGVVSAGESRVSKRAKKNAAIYAARQLESRSTQGIGLYPNGHTPNAGL